MARGGRERRQGLKINKYKISKEKRKPGRAGLEVLREAGPEGSHPGPQLTFPPHSRRPLDLLGPEGSQKNLYGQTNPEEPYVLPW